jgi:DNA-binding NtrC family response regulator
MNKAGTLDREWSIPGTSDIARVLDQEITRIARSESDVLLEGESGTGKRFFASLIHLRSTRRKRNNFVEVTPQTPDGELRVILFEEDRERQEGILGKSIPQLNDRSTLFINHIEEFGRFNQTLLARFLIQNSFVGTNGRNKPRVIFSTLTSWSKLVENKRVVDSLDQNIREFELFVVPSLRERSEDIPAMAELFVMQMTGNGRHHGLSIDRNAFRPLQNREWTDNVRELRMVVKAAAENSHNGVVAGFSMVFDEVEKVKEIVKTIQSGKRFTIEESLEFLEKRFIQRALMRCGFDLAKTAHVLGLREQNLRYRLRKYNLRNGHFTSEN